MVFARAQCVGMSLLVLASQVAAGVLLVSGAQAASFTPLGDLQTAGESGSDAGDVSDDGSVVVGKSGGGPLEEPVRWTAATGMVRLAMSVTAR